MIVKSNIIENMRSDLAIPESARVFAYYGGATSFNISFVKDCIKKVVEANRMIYFLFMNIPSFIKHQQVIFLDGATDLNYKTKFINTADAMIHARGLGESFGLACGEFSIHNKPIITYAFSPQRSHLDILAKRAILYRGPKELQQILVEFDPSWALEQDWDCYSAIFSPRKVMEKFKEVFLKPDSPQHVIKLSLMDHAMVQSCRLQKKYRHFSKKIYLYFS